MSRPASYYAHVLEELYRAIKGLDVSGYRTQDSDGWSQARHLGEHGRPTEHLETLIDLGGAEVSASFIDHDARLYFHFRYSPDDDSLSQARMHAAARDVTAMLDKWSLPTGERTATQRYQPLSPDEDGSWVLVELTFLLRIPRS